MLRLAKKTLIPTKMLASTMQAVAQKPRCTRRVHFEAALSVASPIHKRLIRTPGVRNPVNGQRPLSTWAAPMAHGYLNNAHAGIQSAVKLNTNLVGSKRPNLEKFTHSPLTTRRHFSTNVQKEKDVFDITQRRYPTDLVHGLLSAHCATETGKEAGNSKVKGGDAVVFSAEHALQGMFGNVPDKDLNAYMTDWRAREVIDDAQTGYCGIVYVNEKARQTVLAHRSTNFALGLTTKNLGMQSGVQTDVESVLMGRIVPHQAFGYVATDKAIEIARKNKTTLSITGHSLGAWLAQLSVYYCHTAFNYTNVKAVTFDGPGAFEMMKQMSAPSVRQAGLAFDPRELDAVSYLSAPNIVNCTNKHIGMAYMLFPDIGKSTLPEWMRNVFGGKNEDALVATMGHHLKHILPHFNVNRGTPEPEKHRRVVKWPSVTHRAYGHTEQSLFKEHVTKMMGDPSFTGRFSAKVLDAVVTRMLGSQATSAGSVYYLLRDWMNGSINEDQFWNVHQRLDREHGYAAVTQDKIGDFELLYRGQYKVEAVNVHEREVTDKIDRYLKNIKLHEDAILRGAEGTLREGLASLVKLYDFRLTDQNIAIKEGCREVTISGLRDRMRILLEECQEPLDKCINVARRAVVELNSNIPLSRNKNIERREKELEEVARLHKQHPVVVVSGVGGVGKSVFAAEYGYVNQDQGSIVRWVYGARGLEESYRDMAKDLDIVVDSKDKMRVVIDRVYAKLATMRPCLLIIDNIENHEVAKAYLVGLPKNVRILITTRKRHFNSEHPEVVVAPFTQEQGLEFVSRVLNVAKERAQKLLETIGVLPLRLGMATAYIADQTNLTLIEDFVASFESLRTKDSRIRSAAEIILEKVRGRTWEVLHWSSYLDPDFIPIKLFEHLGLSKTELQEVTKSLERTSLAEVVTNGNGEHGLRVHRFIQTEVRDYANLRKDVVKKGENEVLGELVKCLIILMPDEADFDQNLVHSERAAKLYSSSASTLSRYIVGNKILINEHIARLSHKVGLYFQHVMFMPKDALLFYEKALEVLKALYSGNHPDIAITLNDIGTAYLDLEKHRHSLSYYEQALTMYKALYPGNHPDIAITLNGIGRVYERIGEYRQSLEYLEKALVMFRTVYPGHHCYIANVLNNIGVTYLSIGEHRQSNIGPMYVPIGKYRQALDYFKQALEVLKALYSGNHPDIARTLNGIGAAYSRIKEYRQALDYLEQALTMLKALYPANNSPDMANTLNGIGTVYSDLEKYRQSLEYFEQALVMFKTFYPDNHRDIANVLSNIGITFRGLEKHRQSLEYLEQSLVMYKTLYSDNHRDIALILHGMGRAYLSLGEYRQGLVHIKQALVMDVTLAFKK